MDRIKADALLHKILDKIDYSKLSINEDKSYFTRLGSNFPFIYDNFQKLYSNREDFDVQLEKLVKTLTGFYKHRRKELKQLDLSREKNLLWHLSQEWVGTTLYLDRYSGSISEFINKIDYLQELGVNLVHLMPILRSPETESDGGYAVSNYRKLNNDFGTIEDLQELSRKLRENKMLLTLDLVLNHTSDQHEWSKKAITGEKKYQDYYYFFSDRDIPDNFEKNMPEVFPRNAPGNFTYQEEIKKWVMTVFHNYQWDLNYTNPDVFIEMVSNLLFLANCGADILRLDAVAFLWKRLGTSCQNEPEVHMILQLMKSCTQVVCPGVLFIAEAIVQPSEIIKYFGPEENFLKECDIAYNATFMVLLWDAIATKNSKLLIQSLLYLPERPAGATWLNYARCHDDIGLGFDNNDASAVGYNPFLHRTFLLDYYTGNYYGSFSTGLPFMFNPQTLDARISGSLASLCGLEASIANNNKAEIEKAIGRIILLHSLIMSIGGIPMLYYGDELATVNDYSFEKDPVKCHDNRWIHRPIMDWKVAEKRKLPGTFENRVFSAVQKLISIRKKTPEFSDRSEIEIIDTGNDHLFAFIRYSESSSIMILCNFDESSHRIKMDFMRSRNFMESSIYDLFSKKEIYVIDDSFELLPYQFYWIRR